MNKTFVIPGLIRNLFDILDPRFREDDSGGQEYE